MKTKFIKIILLVSMLSGIFNVHAQKANQQEILKLAKEGGISSGGGSVFIDSSGRVLFKDTNDNVQISKASSELILQTGSGNKRIASVLTSFENFNQKVENALLPWTSTHPDLIKYIVSKSSTVSAYYMNFNLFAVLQSAGVNLEQMPQLPVAMFDENTNLYIYKNVFERMTEQDKAALLVHEALRNYSYMREEYIGRKLWDHEIEEATQILMGPVDSELVDRLNELLSFEVQSSDVIVVDNKRIYTMSDLELIINEFSRKYESFKCKYESVTSTESVTTYFNEYLVIAKAANRFLESNPTLELNFSFETFTSDVRDCSFFRRDIDLGLRSVLELNSATLMLGSINHRLGANNKSLMAISSKLNNFQGSVALIVELEKGYYIDADTLEVKKGKIKK